MRALHTSIANTAAFRMLSRAGHEDDSSGISRVRCEAVGRIGTAGVAFPTLLSVALAFRLTSRQKELPRQIDPPVLRCCWWHAMLTNALSIRCWHCGHLHEVGDRGRLIHAHTYRLPIFPSR